MSIKTPFYQDCVPTQEEDEIYKLQFVQSFFFVYSENDEEMGMGDVDDRVSYIKIVNIINALYVLP